jgi:hypothetical protein
MRNIRDEWLVAKASHHSKVPALALTAWVGDGHMDDSF